MKIHSFPVGADLSSQNDQMKLNYNKIIKNCSNETIAS